MKRASEIFIKEFDYSLPEDKIAIHPLKERDKSKMLVYKAGRITSTRFDQLPEYLPDSSIMVLNNTRVIEARILFQKQTGGIVEIFCLEPKEPFVDINEELSRKGSVQWQCFIGGASKWKPKEILQKEIVVNNKTISLNAGFIEKNVDSFTIEFFWSPAECNFIEVMHAAGDVPLPPYIKRKAVEIDAERYQTIFAQTRGSVAAPTAALHFTPNVFEDLAKKNISTQYVTLHVGAGTFKPVKTETIAEHQMHAERFQVSLQTLNQLTADQVYIAVGTTSLRTLESLYWIGIKIIKKLFKPGEVLNLSQWEAYELQNENISFAESMKAIIGLFKKQKIEEVFC